ncbi:MAG: hypothetical protein R3B93_08945 [Bacteroidia bacterium]
MKPGQNSQKEELLNHRTRKCFHKVYLEYTQEDDFLFDFNAHLLMYRSYYLQKNWADIESRYHGFIHHIKNHKKCSEIHREAGTNFLKMVNQLYQLQITENRLSDQVKKLEEKIENEPRLAMKPWLLKQIAELY